MQEYKCIENKAGEAREYQRTKMQKDIVIQRLKDEGCRITKQRLRLLDIILEEDCSSCKEIYYKACKMGYGIGTATVYRMINTLESIGAISRRNMYKIACSEKCDMEACTIEFDDSTVCHLSASKLNAVITEGLRACGYDNKRNIKSVIVRECECDDKWEQQLYAE